MGTQYPKERKDAIINKMLPPQNMTVPELAQLESIPLGYSVYMEDAIP